MAFLTCGKPPTAWLQTAPLTPATPVAADKPLALEVGDPAIELVLHGLVLLVAEPVAGTRFGGDLLPE